MSYQVQCPNCGGYKVSSEIGYVRPDSNSTEEISFQWGWIIAGVVVGFAMLGYSLGVVQSPRGNILEGIGGTLCGAFFFLGSLYAIFANLTMKKTRLFKFTCLLCGYRWNTREE
jgi:hypothetical protein